MSRTAGLGPRDRFAAAMVLAVRNVGIATAVTVLARTSRDPS